MSSNTNKPFNYKTMNAPPFVLKSQKAKTEAHQEELSSNAYYNAHRNEITPYDDMSVYNEANNPDNCLKGVNWNMYDSNMDAQVSSNREKAFGISKYPFAYDSKTCIAARRNYKRVGGRLSKRRSNKKKSIRRKRR
jgi:hypothetical protein